MKTQLSQKKKKGWNWLNKEKTYPRREVWNRAIPKLIQHCARAKGQFFTMISLAFHHFSLFSLFLRVYAILIAMHHTDFLESIQIMNVHINEWTYWFLSPGWFLWGGGVGVGGSSSDSPQLSHSISRKKFRAFRLPWGGTAISQVTHEVTLTLCTAFGRNMNVWEWKKTVITENWRKCGRKKLLSIVI